MSETENKKWERWLCTVCGYIYDPEIGDPTQGVDPGTEFRDLPENWLCPQCGVDKESFDPIE